VQFPATAPVFHRLSVSTRPSLQNSAYSGRHGGSLPISWGRGRKVMHLPCKQVDVGALPTDSTISLRETRPMHREKPHKLLQVGVTPTPATNHWEVIRLPDCKSGVAKQSRKRRTGALPALPTSLRSQRSESKAAAPEHPAKAGSTDCSVKLRLGKPFQDP
jgi:hypothetical protein